MTDKLYRAYLFFKGQGGHASPPGRAACALALARAEQEGKEMGMVFLWTDDQRAEAVGADGKYHWHDAEECSCWLPDEMHENGGLCLASLGAIVGADETYRRIVEAELALCVLEALRIATAPPEACEKCNGPLALHDTGEALHPMCGPCQVGPPLDYK